MLAAAVALLVVYAVSARDALRQAEDAIRQWEEAERRWEYAWAGQRCDRLYFEFVYHRNAWSYYYGLVKGDMLAVSAREREFLDAIGVRRAEAQSHQLMDSVRAVSEELCGKEYEPGDWKK